MAANGSWKVWVDVLHLVPGFGPATPAWASQSHWLSRCREPYLLLRRSPQSLQLWWFAQAVRRARHSTRPGKARYTHHPSEAGNQLRSTNVWTLCFCFRAVWCTPVMPSAHGASGGIAVALIRMELAVPPLSVPSAA